MDRDSSTLVRESEENHTLVEEEEVQRDHDFVQFLIYKINVSACRILADLGAMVVESKS